jgi:cellulose synthase/poly-beta-1,6-N-acetylglucosamine synthase-like glycosyltransferase
MIFAALLIFVSYAILILYFSSGIERLKSPVNDHKEPETLFSILVPFRNEVLNLPALLQSIAALDYPSHKFELILINDNSSDESVSIVNVFIKDHPNLKITQLDNIKQSRSPKKSAITIGVASASHPWILTTDADCIVPHTWLHAYDMMVRQEKFRMIVAPVAYVRRAGFLHNFQVLDFLSLQGTTMGSFGMKDKRLGKPFLCNGANLCYQKESFTEVNGFNGNEHLASGDDVFLLEKMYKLFPDEIQFIKSKEAIVLTSSKDSLRELIRQRVRWASKTTGFDSFFAKLVGLLVFGTSLFMVIAIILGVMGQMSWAYVGLLFLLKFNVDFVFLHKTSEFFEQQDAMKSYFFSSLLYPLFTILIVALSLKKGYTWKGRVFR